MVYVWVGDVASVNLQSSNSLFNRRWNITERTPALFNTILVTILKLLVSLFNVVFQIISLK